VAFKIAGKSNDGFNVYDRSWNLMSAGEWKYSPNDSLGIKTPLAVGKTWTFRSSDINAGSGFGWNRSGNSKIVSQETVTTQAVRDVQNRNDLFEAKRQGPDPERRGNGADLVRTGDRSLGQAYVYLSGREASASQQYHRTH